MSTDAEVLKTVFYDYHLAAGGKMVPFAGYLMPVQYSSGIMQEHLHCRDNVGLFDVSHMGQIIVEGEGAAQALEKLMPVDLESLGINQQTYATLTNEQGGVMDDLIVTRWAENVFFFWLLMPAANSRTWNISAAICLDLLFATSVSAAYWHCRAYAPKKLWRSYPLKPIDWYL